MKWLLMSMSVEDGQLAETRFFAGFSSQQECQAAGKVIGSTFEMAQSEPLKFECHPLLDQAVAAA
jgi:hypothetical protein